MIELIAASLVWALSFGMMARYLADVDSTFVAFARLVLCAAVFAPFLRRHPRRRVLGWMLLGGVQFGLMYLLYTASYRYLDGYQVAIFTVLTPFHVLLLDSMRTRTLSSRDAIAVVVSVIGALVITWDPLDARGWQLGFGCVQLANLCFALGQVAYRREQLDSRRPVPHAEVFAWLYLGAALLTAIVASVAVDFPSVHIERTEIVVILYLGLLPSGVGFFLWNRGATRVGAGTLAIFNNLKVPLAVLLALLLFREEVDLSRLLVGSLLIASGFVIVASHRKGASAGAMR